MILLNNIMKTLYRFLCLIICTLTLCGCSNTTKVNGNVEVIPIDFDKSEKVAMGDIFSKIEVITLEGGPDSYLKGAKDLKMKNGVYYLQDGQSVYSFDKTGRFIYSTKGRRGRGAQEYFAANDFYVSDAGNICILENTGDVSEYDSLLSLKNKYKVPLKNVYFYGDFMPLSKDILVVSTSHIKNDSTFWNFFSIPKNKIVGSYVISGIKKGGFHFGGSSKYLSNKGQTLYKLSFSSYSLYRLNPDDCTVTEAYRYDLGKYAFDISDIDELEDVTTFLQNNYKKYIFLMDMKMNNKYLISRIGYLPFDGSLNSDIRLSFYSLADGRQRLFDNHFYNDKCILDMYWADDSAIYSFMNVYDEIENFYEDSLLDEGSRNRLKNVNDDTNALIFKYYLRDDIL